MVLIRDDPSPPRSGLGPAPGTLTAQTLSVFGGLPPIGTAGSIVPPARKRLHAPAGTLSGATCMVSLDTAKVQPSSRMVYKMVHKSSALRASRSMPMLSGQLANSISAAPAPASKSDELASATPTRVRPVDVVDASATPTLAVAGDGAPLPEARPAPPAVVPDLSRSSSMAMPLIRGREKISLLRHSPLFCLLSDEALISLSTVAVEKEVARYSTIRPVRSIFVLAYGALALQETTMKLTASMLPELHTTAPNIDSASAAGAVEIDCVVAGTVSDPGATLGLHQLTGGLIGASASFLATEPSLLLQIPIGPVHAILPPRTLEAVASEAALRMLLALRAFKESSAPVPQVRALAGMMRLERVPAGTELFFAEDEVEDLFILIHGRVDLYTVTGELFETVRSTMTPPLGVSPYDGEPQQYSAITADDCTILVGGPASASHLAPLLAPREMRDVPSADPDQMQAAAPSSAPSAAASSGSGVQAAGVGIFQALAAMRMQGAAGGHDEVNGAPS